jgi:hypothetical protein
MAPKETLESQPLPVIFSPLHATARIVIVRGRIVKARIL